MAWLMPGFASAGPRGRVEATANRSMVVRRAGIVGFLFREGDLALFLDDCLTRIHSVPGDFAR
jgi:hypothetical protein